MPYNRWYLDTYQPILGMATWRDFSADVEKKIVCIFSWMPQTVMMIKHPGKRTKAEVYDVDAVRAALSGVNRHFESIRGVTLKDLDVNAHRPVLEALCNALFPLVGSVAASKYLHFSAPELFPMWDRTLRINAGLRDSADGYIRYVDSFRRKLRNARNYRAALKACPDNAIRGWDIVCMGRR